jgi:hypothetical protein
MSPAGLRLGHHGDAHWRLHPDRGSYPGNPLAALVVEGERPFHAAFSL